MTRLGSPFRVVVLTGWDAPSTLLAVKHLLTIPGVEIAAIVFDGGAYPLKTRLRRFWRRGRREGLSYLFFHLIGRVGRLVVRRVGVSNAFDVLDLRAQIEGVDAQGIRQRIRSLWGLPHPCKPPRGREPVSVAEKKPESA